MARQHCAISALVGQLLLLGIQVSAAAQSRSTPASPAPAVIDPLVAIVDADPLELARVVQHLGDRAVLDRLASKRGVEVRLAAIRATPYLREPEQALSVLAPIVVERDGVLAQAAARAVWLIVSALSHDTLERHESAALDLAKVTQEITRIAGLPHVRADLRAQMNAAAAMLAGLGVSASH